jgi:hypothetical protein
MKKYKITIKLKEVEKIKVYEIIYRNNKQFFMPEVEND